MRFIGVILLVLAISGIAVVLFQIIGLKAGYEVESLQKKMEALLNERQNLLLELGELTSIDKIRQYAQMNGFNFMREVVFIELKENLMKVMAP